MSQVSIRSHCIHLSLVLESHLRCTPVTERSGLVAKIKFKIEIKKAMVTMTVAAAVVAVVVAAMQVSADVATYMHDEAADENTITTQRRLHQRPAMTTTAHNQHTPPTHESGKSRLSNR